MSSVTTDTEWSSKRLQGDHYFKQKIAENNIFWAPTFILDSNKIPTKNIFQHKFCCDSKNFVPIFYLSEFFMDHKFFLTTIFSEPIFFWTQNFVRHTFFLTWNVFDPQFSGTQIVLEPKKFRTQFFLPNKRPKQFSYQNLQTKFLCNLKCFETQHVLDPTNACDPVLFEELKENSSVALLSSACIFY